MMFTEIININYLCINNCVYVFPYKMDNNGKKVAPFYYRDCELEY